MFMTPSRMPEISMCRSSKIGRLGILGVLDSSNFRMQMLPTELSVRCKASVLLGSLAGLSALVLVARARVKPATEAGPAVIAVRGVLRVERVVPVPHPVDHLRVVTMKIVRLMGCADVRGVARTTSRMTGTVIVVSIAVNVESAEAEKIAATFHVRVLLSPVVAEKGKLGINAQ